MRVRWIGPIIPPLVILSMYGLQRILIFLSNDSLTLRNVSSKLLIAGILAVMLYYNASYIIGLYNSVKPFSYVTGAVTRDAYIEKRWPEYAALMYANTHLEENDRILGIFIGKRGYYSNKEIFFNFHLLDDSVKSSESPDNISNIMNRKRITHLLINQNLFRNWVKSHFNKQKQRLLNEYMKTNLTLVFSKNGYHLYQCR